MPGRDAEGCIIAQVDYEIGLLNHAPVVKSRVGGTGKGFGEHGLELARLVGRLCGIMAPDTLPVHKYGRYLCVCERERVCSEHGSVGVVGDVHVIIEALV